jgi:predicted aspartyl protease
MKTSLISIAAVITLLGAGRVYATLPQELTPLAAAIAGSAEAIDRIEPLYAIPTLRDRVGRLVAPVLVNGHGPFRFMLDTGASHSVITSALALKLGLVPDESALVSVHGVSGTVIVPSVYLAELTAGALRLESLQVPVLTGSALEDYDGVLGMDGLGGMRVTADFLRDRVTISRSSGRQSSRSYIALPGRLVSHRLLIVDARVGGVKIKAVIDTGASHTLGNPALLAALSKHRSFTRRTVIASVADTTATLQNGEMHITPQMDFGGASVRGADVTFSDFAIFKTFGLSEQPAVLIGMDVLGTLGEMTIDYRRQELQLRAQQPRFIRRL